MISAWCSSKGDDTVIDVSPSTLGQGHIHSYSLMSLTGIGGIIHLIIQMIRLGVSIYNTIV